MYFNVYLVCPFCGMNLWGTDLEECESILAIHTKTCKSRPRENPHI